MHDTQSRLRIRWAAVVAAAASQHLMLFVRETVFISQVTATWTPD